MVVIHLGGVAHLALLGGSTEVAIQWGSLPFVTADFGKIGIASLVISRARRRFPSGR
jgi:biotin transporter BioY